jgi:hypothetical protein
MSTTDERNAATSRAEVAAFMADVPERHFAYAATQRSGFDTTVRLHVGDEITTWTGDKLAQVCDARQPFRDSFGGIRQNFRARAINGATYSGTFYLSSGDYVRMRKVKAA